MMEVERPVNRLAGVQESETVSRRALSSGLAVGLCLALCVMLGAPRLREGLLRLMPSAAAPPGSIARVEPGVLAQAIRQAERQVAGMQRRLDARLPRGAYLVVSSADNTFRLQRGLEVLREGLCSTGSYVQLKGHDTREWLFETPRGMRRVQRKRENPVWVKPDWAFVEAGLPVPPAESPLRIERNVLGDYALSLGDGYLIHGTLYQRLLGRPVTHGCVRLGNADLAAVYRTLPVGAPVFIY